jgi:DNA-binding beta-propeller fold protein YncE
VLSTNGKINKFNKGAAENFSITGLDKDLLNPTRIYTNSDQTYVYVLDNGNSRIVVLEKSGRYKTQYQASIIKSAKDFDVDEKNNKIFVLQSGKVYQIDLK